MSKRTRLRPSKPYYGKAWKLSAKMYLMTAQSIADKEDEAFMDILRKEYGLTKDVGKSMRKPKLPTQREIARQFRRAVNFRTVTFGSPEISQQPCRQLQSVGRVMKTTVTLDYK